MFWFYMSLDNFVFDFLVLGTDHNPFWIMALFMKIEYI